MLERAIAKPGEDGPRTVLIVDDDADVRYCTRMLLESDGHFVIEAEDGLVALKTLMVVQPDLVLLDWFMPGMSGDRFLDAIEHTGVGIDVPVVVLSGYDDPPARNLFVLRKPVDPKYLLGIVRHLPPPQRREDEDLAVVS